MAFKDMRLSKKLPILFVLVSIISIVSVGLLINFTMGKALEELAIERLEALGETRYGNVRRELDNISFQVSSSSVSAHVAEALVAFSDSFDAVENARGNALEHLQKAYITDNPNPTGQKHLLDAASGVDSYNSVHGIYHPFFRTMLEQTQYYDIFLIDPQGNVVYSVFKELDYATNLVTGEWSDSGLATVARTVAANPAKGTMVFDDFKPYGPSADAPASFLAAPVFVSGRFAGSFIIQIPVDRLNLIVNDATGLGAVGDSVLVGSDRMMRTDSRFVAEGETSILATEQKSGFVEAALDGQSGVGREVLEGRGEFFTFYKPVDFEGERWAIMLDIGVDEALHAVHEIGMMIFVVGGVVLLFVVGMGWYFARGIVSPLSRSTGEMLALADGDRGFDISGEDRGDEIGDIARALSVFKENAIKQDEMAEKEAEMVQFREERTRKIESLIQNFEEASEQILQDVASSATQMTTTSDELLKSAEDANLRSNAVAAAAEEASANVQTVASAAEELSSSIDEINRQVKESNSIADEAVSEVTANVKTIRQLEEASNRIGEVVQLISEIAEQTNLLALNATIEAARAGEAGKGFAVVASEVKNLANQTAKATEDISGQVQEIQQVTKGAVGAIEGVGDTVHRMSEISASVAVSIDQQGAATSEISRSVQEASAGTAEVTTNIHAVSAASGQTDGAARSVSQVAKEVSDRATMMRELVGTFSRDIKAV